MKLMGLCHIDKLCDTEKSSISIFKSDIEQANWRNLDDIAKAFPQLQYFKSNIYEISIVGTNLLLVLKINFHNQMVLIKEVKSF